MSGRKSYFGKDLTNTKGRNDPGQLRQDKGEPKMEPKKLLKKEQVICPICYSIILEPVTFPCNHNICRPCFDIHIWETSINCPCCRRRLSIWCRKAVKENAVVNVKLQEEIEAQFPLQVAAQKERLQLPPEERKLDHVLVEFLADDSPRIPPRQFAKTGEIAKEFNDILSKHLQDLHLAEESATEAFISKCVTPEEQEAIRELEENLKLGEGLKEKNEKCLGDGISFIKLRARTVQLVDLKSSPGVSKAKMSRTKPTTSSLTSPKTSVSTGIQPSESLLRTSQADTQPVQVVPRRAKVPRSQFKVPDDQFEKADLSTRKRGHDGPLETLTKHMKDLRLAEESASKAFIAKSLTLEEQEAIRNLEGNLKIGEGLKQKNEECFGLGGKFIKLRTRTVPAVAFNNSPVISKQKKFQLEATSDSRTSPKDPLTSSPRPSVSPQIAIGIQPSKSPCANQAGVQPAEVFPRPAKVPRRQFKVPDDQLNQADLYTRKRGQHGSVENLTKNLQDLRLAEESTSKAFSAKGLTPKEEENIRNLEENLGEGLKQKNEECLGLGGNFVKLRARTVQAVDMKRSPGISKAKKSKLGATSNAHTSPKPSVSTEIQPSISPITKPAKVPRGQFKVPDDQFEHVDVYKMLCMTVGDPWEQPSNKIQTKKTPIIATQVGAHAAQVFPCQSEVSLDQFTPPSEPFEQADLYKTKRGHLGSAYQVFQDHTYFMRQAPSSSSAKESKRSAFASCDEKRMLEEKDQQLALQLQKYFTEAFHNLRQRNPK